jgi:hypothetical protein
MFMFCVSFIDVFCGLFYGVPTLSVGVFYIFHLFFELGCIRRVCIRTFAVIEREVRAVSHRGYRQALRFFVWAKRVTIVALVLVAVCIAIVGLGEPVFLFI